MKEGLRITYFEQFAFAVRTVNDTERKQSEEFRYQALIRTPDSWQIFELMCRTRTLQKRRMWGPNFNLFSVEIYALLGYHAAWSGDSVPTFRDNLSAPSWTLKTGPIACPETSVWNLHSKLRNIPEERRSHLHRGESLKSRISLLVLQDLWSCWTTQNTEAASCSEILLRIKCTLVQVLRLCTGPTAHRGSRGIALTYLDHATRRGEGSASRPGPSLPPGKTRYPLYIWLGGPQGRYGQVWKISPPPGFVSRTVQPVASRYTGYATRPSLLRIILRK